VLTSTPSSWSIYQTEGMVLRFNVKQEPTGGAWGEGVCVEQERTGGA
jgi:hypothetical protein